MTSLSILQNIPCTLVTGFLGSGKTSIINQLLYSRPVDERWALLINEFGKIGIDGSLLNSAANKDNSQNNIAISEVSGGCICCTSQLPLQIALTRLLTDHRPQRLIIEPTGLAHPRELLRQLSAEHWQTALSMQAIISVLSAIQWQQQKYRNHEGFQAHIRAADVVAINRHEQLNTIELQDLQQWLIGLNKQANIIWLETKVQTIDKPIDSWQPIDNDMSELTAYLNIPSTIISQQRAIANQSRIDLATHLPKTSMTSNDIAKTNINNELPYHYHDEQQNMLLGGWCLPAHWVFDFDPLKVWLLQLHDWQRIKGIIHTSKGWLAINFTPDSLTTNPTKAQPNSRLEIILEMSDLNNNINSKDYWAACHNELIALITE